MCRYIMCLKFHIHRSEARVHIQVKFKTGLENVYEGYEFL